MANTDPAKPAPGGSPVSPVESAPAGGPAAVTGVPAPAAPGKIAATMMTGTGNGFLNKPMVRDSIFALIAVVGLFFIGILFMHLSKEDDLLGKLRDGAYARGVITFLIAIASIGLCFIMILHSLFSPPDKEGENFRRAREVLALLVGILGTIVGYYFGATDKMATEIKVADMQAEIRGTGTNSQWELSTFVSGGAPPYRYGIDFEPASAVPVDIRNSLTNKLAEGGWIKAKLGTTNILTVTLKVLDKNECGKEVKKELKASASGEKK